MTTTRVIVPVKNQWHHTERLLDSLAGEDCVVLVLDNGSTDDTAKEIRRRQRAGRYPTITRTSLPGRSIYELWNHGFSRATSGSRHAWNRERYVLITNNDIELPRGAITHLRNLLACDPRHWVAYPDYDAEWQDDVGDRALTTRTTRGVLSDGGMFGACFMLAAHRVPWRPLITDTTYEWWYGDNHLAEDIEQHGGTQVRVVGLPVKHANEATASTLDPAVLYGMKYRDRQRWLTRYERNT